MDWLLSLWESIAAVAAGSPARVTSGVCYVGAALRRPATLICGAPPATPRVSHITSTGSQVAGNDENAPPQTRRQQRGGMLDEWGVRKLD